MLQKMKRFISSFLFCISSFYIPECSAQSGTLKSKNGFMIFYASDSLNFTLRLDNPNTEIPNWLHNNYLQLFKDQFYIQIIKKDSLFRKNTDERASLYMFQKWETDYIESSMKPSIKRSAFMSDNDSIKFNRKDLLKNAWYYSVELNPRKLYFYFYDIYKNGCYIRITFTGSLDSARGFIPVVLKGLQFYNKNIQLNKLQDALKKGQYGYNE